MQIYSKNNKNCFFSLISWPIFILFVLSDRARWRLQNLYTKFWNSLIMLIYANLRSPGRDPGVQSALKKNIYILKYYYYFFFFHVPSGASYLYFSHSNFFIFSPFPGHQMFIFWPVENCTTWNLRYLMLRDAGWALRHWRSCYVKLCIHNDNMLSGGNQTGGEFSQKISDPLPKLQIAFKGEVQSRITIISKERVKISLQIGANMMKIG